MERLRILRATELQHRGHEVKYMADFLSQLSPRYNTRGPIGNQRRGNAALVNPHLVLPERRVGGIRPTDFETPVRLASAGFAARLVSARRIRPGIEELRA